MSGRVFSTLSFAVILVSATAVPGQQAQARVRRLQMAVPPQPAAIVQPAAMVLGPACAPACPPPCCLPVNICYKHRGCRMVCCDPCAAPIKETLTLCHPCTGCPIAVPVCLPACCTGCPTVSERCTLIGCGAVTYTWCCGFSATVRFTRCGDVTVVYRG